MSNETNPVVGLVVPAGAFAFPRERIRFDREQVAAATAALHDGGGDFVESDREFGDSRVDQDVEHAFESGAEFIESALGATPTVAEMTADLGKLTLPEVIFVKDCECGIAGRARVRIGPPVVCLVCGKAWTRTYGPSNDAPREVQIEIRAAELAYRPSFRYTNEEWSGWSDYDTRRDDAIPETDGNWSGYLSAALEDHDQEHPPDGQRNAVRDLVNKGMA